MMRDNLIASIAGLLMAALIVITIVLNIGTDREAPKIQFDGDIEFEEGQDLEVLLAGVSAVDQKDGDVSSAIMVDSLIVLDGNEFAKVTYSAKDHSNNIAKATRIVGYSGSGESIYATHTVVEEETNTEETTASSPEMMSLGTQENSSTEEATVESTEQKESITQEETTSGEIQTEKETIPKETIPEETKTERETASEETKTEKDPTKQESESDLTQTTKAEEETTKQSVTEGAPVLELSQSSCTITAGKRFNVSSYVQKIEDDKDHRETLYRRIGIEGSYDSNTIGEYTFKVYCIDSDRNLSNKENFTLHVVAE